MLNALSEQLACYAMVTPGDRVTCAVSGGADSMALLWAMYLLKDKLQLQLQAAHFNHHLRGAESDRDEAFVREFCSRFEIPLTVGSAWVTPGEKGLEAAAREARYAFFNTLPGKIATAHTADDNAETVLMHLVRGTGLKGLGGIAPVRGKFLRPLLTVTRQQVLAFLDEYHIRFVEDSSNGSDAFLRNRLRHGVMPLLKQENPRLAQTVSQMAMALRQDAEVLEALAQQEQIPDVKTLRAMEPAVRSRVLERFLKQQGVKEPERQHILLAEQLVFSKKPSASACFPGNVTICRNYDRLERSREQGSLPETVLLPGQRVRFGEYWVECIPAQKLQQTKNCFTVQPRGAVTLRSRKSGDAMRLPGGTKSLKKLFIDKKIPAMRRLQIPVIADGEGVLGVGSIGGNLDRQADSLPAMEIRIEKENS